MEPGSKKVAYPRFVESTGRVSMPLIVLATALGTSNQFSIWHIAFFATFQSIPYDSCSNTCRVRAGKINKAYIEKYRLVIASYNWVNDF